MQYPNALIAGSKIAVCAFSSGVAEAFQPRLTLALTHFEALGFKLVLDPNLNHNHQHVSAPKEIRASQLMQYLLDDSIDAILPPWGGEFAMELLDLLDYDKLAAAKPKWIIGFSDVSTLQIALSTRLGWASMHTANLMQLVPNQQDDVTQAFFRAITLGKGECFSQTPSNYFEKEHSNIIENPETPYNLTERTNWQTLNWPNKSVSGRLIGGCLDTIIFTLDSPYFDLASFCESYQQDGVILYIENAELSPTAWLRALLMLKFRGHLSRINALLIGRHAGAIVDKQLDFHQALKQAEIHIPIMFDMDIGHQAPNLTLINGALCEITPELELKQTLI
ncbi:S66 family peptidase [Pseudoalteromonas sp. SSM20]|uniref:S66 family peptidase n=1 Tax=Pseudoalteromonas sp. SSM20 TaxID=3139394 RepID=UPI003BAB9DAB